MAEKLNTSILEVLKECKGYFEGIADADHDNTGYVPNLEMYLLGIVRAAIEKAENEVKPMEEIKYLALTMGAPDHLPVPNAISRIISICRKAGVTKTLPELAPPMVSIINEPIQPRDDLVTAAKVGAEAAKGLGNLRVSLEGLAKSFPVYKPKNRCWVVRGAEAHRAFVDEEEARAFAGEWGKVIPMIEEN